MPVYVFHCSRCRKDFEVLSKLDDNSAICPECGEITDIRKMSSTSFKLGYGSGSDPLEDGRHMLGRGG